MVLEHVSSAAGVQFVKESGENVAATVTVQHLLLTVQALVSDGLRPHNYCHPILKFPADRAAVIDVLRMGHARFFAGTDSAPHAKGMKECAVASAGCYTAYASLSLYAHAFEQMGIPLAHLSAFLCENGARFYGVELNAKLEENERIRVQRIPWQVPASYPFTPDQVVVPFRAGELLNWQISFPAQNKKNEIEKEQRSK